MHVTFEQIGQALIDLNLNSDDDAIDEARMLLSDLTPAVREHLATLGMSADDTGVIFDPTQLDAIDAFCSVFNEEYDSNAADDPTSQWQRFGLSGDDDLDYNSGFVGMLTDALRKLS